VTRFSTPTRDKKKPASSGYSKEDVKNAPMEERLAESIN
jgi:hypothetical protein